MPASFDAPEKQAEQVKITPRIAIISVKEAHLQ
jgi:hypothetical protein